MNNCNRLTFMLKNIDKLINGIRVVSITNTNSVSNSSKINFHLIEWVSGEHIQSQICVNFSFEIINVSFDVSEDML